MSYALESGVTDSSGQGRVVIGDGANLDSFSRLRVSNLYTLFDSTAEYGRSNYFWETSTSGTGSTTTYLPNESSINLVCGTENTAYCIRQSKEYWRYQPGKSQLIINTFNMGAAVAGVTKRIGYFDASNGIFLEQKGTTDVALVRRTFVSGTADDKRTVQADWNLDTLSGVGGTRNPSGIILDLSKVHILVIDLQWLGVGRVRVGFDIGGVVIYVHEFLHANVLTTVYMTSATLPVRYEIRNTAVQAGVNNIKQICSSVSVEGGLDEGIAYTFGVPTTLLATAVTTRRAILSIRPKATFGPSSKVNRTKFIPLDSHLLVGTNNAIVEYVYNPTFVVAGGALTWTSADAESAMEYCIHGDANAGAFTAGVSTHVMLSASGSGSFKQELNETAISRYPLVLDSSGANPTAFSIVVTSTTGTTNINACMNWKEIR